MMLFIQEGRGTPGGSSGTDRGINDGVFVPTRGHPRDLPDDVHWKGTTVCYIDGHAKWMHYNQLVEEREGGYWTPAGH